MQDIQGSIHLKYTLYPLTRPPSPNLPKGSSGSIGRPAYDFSTNFGCADLLSEAQQFQKEGLHRSHQKSLKLVMASLGPLDGANHTWNCHYLGIPTAERSFPRSKMNTI